MAVDITRDVSLPPPPTPEAPGAYARSLDDIESKEAIGFGGVGGPIPLSISFITDWKKELWTLPDWKEELWHTGWDQGPNWTPKPAPTKETMDVDMDAEL